MDILNAIEARRSIRKFQDAPVEEKKLRAILSAALLAPSGKNRQPWRFIVIRSSKRGELVRILQEGIDRTKARGENAGSSEWTAKVIAQAPVTVFVYNPEGRPPWLAHSVEQNFDDVVDIQSAGAAIQNMLLAAQGLGIGSLWICDVFYAYEEIGEWLGEKGEMIAAVALGYADEQPAPRPRKKFEEAVRMA